MAYKTERIYRTLRLIDRRYNAVAQKNNRNTDARLKLLSKLALLELCGWIEMTVDQILMEYVFKHIQNSQEQTRIRRDIVDKVYGFSPNRNFWPLFERILGVMNCWNLKMVALTPNQLSIFESKLNDLTLLRNRHAHTYYHAALQITVWAPSRVLATFFDIYPIMLVIQKGVKRL